MNERSRWWVEVVMPGGLGTEPAIGRASAMSGPRAAGAGWVWV
jgi:hypothetical protein